MSGGHFQKVFIDCGHIGAQCRCPGPKKTEHIPGKCPKCVAVNNDRLNERMTK